MKRKISVNRLMENHLRTPGVTVRGAIAEDGDDGEARRAARKRWGGPGPAGREQGVKPLSRSQADMPAWGPRSGIAEDFDLASYDFPSSEELIAQAPVQPRDASRLLILDRKTGEVSHAWFRDLPRHLRPGDCLVLNRTKVLPARLLARKSTGGKVDMLLLRELDPGLWTALSSDLKPDARLSFDDGIHAVVESLNPEGEWLCRFSTPDVRGLMLRRGLPPLPPYILRRRRASAATSETQPADPERYQTVYARDEGSVAAPTAGLHFTPQLLDALKALGVRVAPVTLHVGHGTFQPLASPDIREHKMKIEHYLIEPQALETLRACRGRGGRIVAVGTTAVRTLETFARSNACEGWTDLFIRPGHAFNLVDALVTNFHQPRSTPLVLACSFAGRDKLLCAYRQAVESGYRLYSFGDAMVIL